MKKELFLPIALIICNIALVCGFCTGRGSIKGTNEGRCFHRGGRVYKSDPVTIERRVGAVAELSTKTYCGDCGCQLIELPDIETEALTMIGCVIAVEDYNETADSNEVKE